MSRLPASGRAALLAWLFSTTSAFAAEPLTRHTLELAGGEFGAPARLTDFNWLVGRWSGAGLDGINEEQWSAPAGGAMMGMYRLIKDGRVAFYELLTLGESGDTLLLTLRHFHPDLRGWEERDEAVRLPFIKAEAGRFYFEGLTMEPRADTLTIYLAIDRKEPKGESVHEVAFSYQRR
ncbi:MAG TPA: DUF6265 family protein [Steroidobacteraceae bacterium]|nr:DUF6265 family protein [Steroidobacteraceae bacterium]